jgi:DNA-binding SARP family transcriptional activator/tetratricopeptide (TPR) repeat protein
MDQERFGDAGELIRGYRSEARLSQRKLADAAGVSIGVIRDLEQRRTAGLRAESVQRLARALRLSRHQAAELARAAQRAPATAPGRPPALRLGVLGPLRAWRGATVHLGGPRQRAVLGLLALHPESGLSRAAIVDTLWGDDPPATAVSMIQSYVSRLRYLLGMGGPDTPLVATAGGYRLSAAACDLDQVAFAALVSRARASHAAGDLPAACEAYDLGLGLWRGEPLMDIEVLRDHPAVTRLNLQRAEAVTGYAAAAAAAGCHDRVLGLLQDLTAREPLNERAHARLMIALAGSGQQAAALALYDALRRRLDDQLGILPGAELADAHVEVLRQDRPGALEKPALSGVTSQPVPAGRPGGDRRAADIPAPVLPVPAQLPHDIQGFTGRDAELAELTRQRAQAAGTLVIAAVAGTAGIGKTALAIHWAHSATGHFPDGQLYANLRGFDPSGQAVEPAEAIRGFLDAFAVPSEVLPASLDAQAALYRSLLASRRILIVLDNARDDQQVRPLLPNSPGCLVVVTSRRHLPGLVASDGARPLNLAPLTAAQARELLAQRIGAGRIAAEPQAAADLIRACAGLPLALAVTSARALSRPDLPLAELTAELHDAARRLSALDVGDVSTSVRAAFSWSYAQLPASQARLFRLLGLHPAPDITVPAAAGLAALLPHEAAAALRRLADASLIREQSAGRFALHDLLRVYAAEQAGLHETEDARHDALTRLLDYYLTTAAAATDTLFPAAQPPRPGVPPPAGQDPEPGAPAGARAWLEAERITLVRITAAAAAGSWTGHAIRLAATLSAYLDTGGYHADSLAVHAQALHAARRTGDHATQAVSLRNIGRAHWRQGRYQEAGDYFRQALDSYQLTGDRRGQADGLNALGGVMFNQGRYQDSIDHRRSALAIYRALDDQLGQARMLSNLGIVLSRLGRYQQAAIYQRQALALSRACGDSTAEAGTLTNIGVLLNRQGQWKEAAAHQRAAVALFRDLGHREGEAAASDSLGIALCGQGDFRQASGQHRHALRLYRETGNRGGEAEALNGLGEAVTAAGDTGQARTLHQQALELATQIGNRAEQARAHEALARADAATNEIASARSHLHSALAIFADLDAPEADRVRANLERLGA